MVVNIDVESFFPTPGTTRSSGPPARSGAGSCRSGRSGSSRISARTRAPCRPVRPPSPVIANIMLTRTRSALTTAAQPRRPLHPVRRRPDVLGRRATRSSWCRSRGACSGAGLRARPKKTNIFRRGRRQIVTGPGGQREGGPSAAHAATAPRRRSTGASTVARRPGTDKPMDDAALGGWLAFLGDAPPGRWLTGALGSGHAR